MCSLSDEPAQRLYVFVPEGIRDITTLSTSSYATVFGKEQGKIQQCYKAFVVDESFRYAGAARQRIHGEPRGCGYTRANDTLLEV